jgi:hypothetical protein
MNRRRGAARLLEAGHARLGKFSRARVAAAASPRGAAPRPTGRRCRVSATCGPPGRSSSPARATRPLVLVRSLSHPEVRSLLPLPLVAALAGVGPPAAEQGHDVPAALLLLRLRNRQPRQRWPLDYVHGSRPQQYGGASPLSGQWGIPAIASTNSSRRFSAARRSSSLRSGEES